MTSPSTARGSSPVVGPAVLRAQTSAVSVAYRLQVLFVVLYLLAFLITSVLHEAAHAVVSALLGGNPVMHRAGGLRRLSGRAVIVGGLVRLGGDDGARCAIRDIAIALTSVSWLAASRLQRC